MPHIMQKVTLQLLRIGKKQMKKLAKISGGIAVVLLGIVSFCSAQESNLIDKIDIAAIRSMSVESDTLYIVTEIKNENKEKIKLSEGVFTFHLRINEEKDAPLKEHEKLGTDSRDREILLKPADVLRKEGDDDANSVIFEIPLGEDQAKVNSTLVRIINAIGNPLRNDPIFYIKGKFYLGVKSDKGWSAVTAGIDWAFRPSLLKRVLLEPSVDFIPDYDFKNDCIAYDDIKFKLDSAKLTPAGKKKVDRYAKILKNDFPNSNFTIRGYACRLGSSKHNLELSQKRAEAVRDYLLNTHGISKSRLKTEWYGENNFDRKRTLPWNRRVEFACEDCCK